MKIWRLATIVVFLLLAATNNAWAYDIDFIMGSPRDNVTSLQIKVEKVHVNEYRLNLSPVSTDTGPGFKVSLIKLGEGASSEGPTERPPVAEGNSKVLQMPGPEDLRNIWIQLSDMNQYNQKHVIKFAWVGPDNKNIWFFVCPK